MYVCICMCMYVYVLNVYIYIYVYMRIGDCLSDYIPVIDVDVCCSSNDFTKTTASAWRSFSLLLQWVLSQKGDCHNPLASSLRVNYVIMYIGP